jgi:hypothetical protein
MNIKKKQEASFNLLMQSLPAKIMKCVFSAGLLAKEHFSNLLPVSFAKQWHPVRSSLLQLRGQLRVYTGFPFNPAKQ